MPDQRDVQQLIQSLTPSAVNNGNPNTVYNQPMPQGGYIPPTYDPGTNTWRVNPAPPAPTVNWQQLAMSQPQPQTSWGMPPAQAGQPPASIPTTNGPVLGGQTPGVGGGGGAPLPGSPVYNSGAGGGFNVPTNSLQPSAAAGGTSAPPNATGYDILTGQWVTNPYTTPWNGALAGTNEALWSGGIATNAPINPFAGAALTEAFGPMTNSYGYYPTNYITSSNNPFSNLEQTFPNGFDTSWFQSSQAPLGSGLTNTGSFGTPSIWAQNQTQPSNWLTSTLNSIGSWLNQHPTIDTVGSALVNPAVGLVGDFAQQYAADNQAAGLSALSGWGAFDPGGIFNSGSNPFTSSPFEGGSFGGSSGNYGPFNNNSSSSNGAWNGSLTGGGGGGGAWDGSLTSDNWGGGGSGDSGGCVVVDSVLSDYDRADDVNVGDMMEVIDPVSYKKSEGRVSYSTTKIMPCVRITTETGVVLDCSTTAPIADERGNQVLAPELKGKLIPVSNDGEFYLDRVESVEDIGEREVRHITVENNFFLAGKEAGKYIFHHNIKVIGSVGPTSPSPNGSGFWNWLKGLLS